MTCPPSSVKRVSSKGEDEHTFVEVRAVVRIPFTESRRAGSGIRIVTPQPSFAMTPSGGFYVMVRPVARAPLGQA